MLLWMKGQAGSARRAWITTLGVLHGVDTHETPWIFADGELRSVSDRDSAEGGLHRSKSPDRGFVLPLEKMTECGQRLKTVADDLSNRQHGHREDPAGNAPHPEPEDERDDDKNGIESEPPSQKHRR
jgi:hypothetical protein